MRGWALKAPDSATVTRLQDGMRLQGSIRVGPSEGPLSTSKGTTRPEVRSSQAGASRLCWRPAGRSPEEVRQGLVSQGTTRSFYRWDSESLNGMFAGLYLQGPCEIETIIFRLHPPEMAPWL